MPALRVAPSEAMETAAFGPKNFINRLDYLCQCYGKTGAFEPDGSQFAAKLFSC